MNISETARKLHSGNPVTKPLSYYSKYEAFLRNHFKGNIESIVEIGTFDGESARILSTSFPKATVLTIDLERRDLDFDLFPNIYYQVADQTDALALVEVINHHFKSGVDLVIDDASHFGAYSLATFNALFPLVKSGGAYFVEDWGTGYWSSWTDGQAFEPLQIRGDSLIPNRISSHDFGMVGFVKSLVDLTHESAINYGLNEKNERGSRVGVLEFGEGVCMLLKA